MTIELKEDLAYILLKKVGDRTQTDEPLTFSAESADFAGRRTNNNEILAHLDYLNQKGYIKADFEGDAYADKGPNPLPDAIRLQALELTPSGQSLLQKMSNNPPQKLASGPSTAIATKDADFLNKVMLKGHIDNIYDARDFTEIVFRTMRDLMTTPATDKVASELHTAASHTDKKAAQEEIVDLWQDSNPIVRLLSKIRPSLNFDADTFLYRVEKEGGLPNTTGPNTVVKAVFSATKDELSEQRIAEIADFMPGKIRTLWEEA
ncbi:MAG: DUF2267 domain-containing protein [Phormidesmis sp. RL_2_1]|nr:DUF2267 domain-containing protein [Phormidesmis sp. RL_2_1]